MSSMSVAGGGYSAYRMIPPPPPPSAAGRQDPMTAVADRLGLSSGELKTELTSGKTLEDVAQARGVTQQELVGAIRAGLPGGDAATAERIAAGNGTPPPVPPAGGAGFNSGMADSDKVEKLGRMLDMKATEVTGQAASATELVQLLQNRGVDLGQLRNILASGDLIDVRA